MQIKTTAPISLDNLKEYYKDKSTTYLVDYKNSTLQGQKFLTYLSNLDLACDIEPMDIDDKFFDLLKTYIYSTSLVNIQFLELATIDMLLEFKGLIQGDRYKQFIDANREMILQWVGKLDSLLVYNTSTIKEADAKAELENFPKDDTDSIDGINWVSLLKNEEFYGFYSKIDPTALKYYTKYFNDYMFKGKNLYSFWANEHNPMFLLTWGIVSKNTTPEDFENALKQEQEQNATLN